MKPIHFLFITLVAAAAGVGGWFASRHWPATQTLATSTSDTARKVAYYQSSMHPWIKSDKPGRCTICGMALSPVYEGDKGFEAGEGVVSLGSNTIQVINVQTDEVKRRPLQRSLRFAGTIDDNDAKHRIVSAYIEFAELQALNRKPMTMSDWIAKLDDFLKLSGRDLLMHAGKISAETAKEKAELEYNAYRQTADAQPRPVDAHFEKAAKQLTKRAKI